MSSVPKPMLCHDLKGEASAIPHGWVIEQKLDGVRLMVVQTASGLRTYGGRNGNEHTGSAPEVEKALAWLPVGTVLDGELCRGEGKNSYRPDGMQVEPLRYVVFDCPEICGVDNRPVPWRARRKLVEELVRQTDGPVDVTAATYDLAAHDRWLAEGFEGSVAKNPDGRYVDKRSRDWLKIKPQATAEAVVVGHVMGKGKSNQHLVGALEVLMERTLAPTTVGYGCDVAEAMAMKGQVIELAHHGISPKSGKPRHPSFRRVRPDRTPESLLA